MADGLPGAVDFGHQPRVGQKIEERVNRLKCLGNAVVPQVSEYIGLLIMETERSGAVTSPDGDPTGNITRGFQATSVAQIADATSESPIIVKPNGGI